MAVTKVYQKVRRNIHDYGLHITLKKCASHILKPFYENRTYRIYTINLEKQNVAIPPDSSFSYKLITASEDRHIDQIEALEEWLQGRVKNMLKNGVLCLAALDGPIVAGFNLVSLEEGNLPLVHYKKKLRPHEAWSEQITVHKDYRGKKLASILRARMFEILKKRGIKKFYGGAQVSNIASLKLARKVGFREIADMQYCNRFGKKSLLCRRYKA